MLIITRKPGQELVLGTGIRVRVAKVNGSRVTLAIDAPADYRVLRGELLKPEVADQKLDCSDVKVTTVQHDSQCVAEQPAIAV